MSQCCKLCHLVYLGIQEINMCIQPLYLLHTFGHKRNMTTLNKIASILHYKRNIYKCKKQIFQLMFTCVLLKLLYKCNISIKTILIRSMSRKNSNSLSYT
ncbi:hypothetical protein NP493_270g01026 [Ridgeia piscesae]|uniref:Uncharacterized protein n=1 Tax=Ridgeia piscesae TaxID=27915 RepID=A0AAD9NXI9_RIDPI|nr:hypothetical protein NP493_270g01026 [Ridgeia piscesae]